MSVTSTTTKSPLEDPNIPDRFRRETEVSRRRFHLRKLGRMNGAFLTVLNRDKQILAFVAGALRYGFDRGEDHVATISTEMIARGFQEGYHPEIQTVRIQGKGKIWRPWDLRIPDIPYLSYMLGKAIPEAAGWGIFRVGPPSDKFFVRDKVNGGNSEELLTAEKWETMVTSGIDGSGCSNPARRLAPTITEMVEQDGVQVPHTVQAGATHYAGIIPSAWGLALVAARLYGGMKYQPVPGCPEFANLEDLPLHPLKELESLAVVRDEEKAFRDASIAACAEKRKQRLQRFGRKVRGATSVASAMDPSMVKAMEATVAGAQEETPAPSA